MIKTNIRHFRHNRKLSGIIKLLLIIIISTFLWSKSAIIFFARHLECYTQYGSCPAEITGRLQWLINTPLFKPLPEMAVKNNLKSIIEIKSIHLFRRLPQTLVLSIELRKPIGEVGNQVLGAYAVADTEGLILNSQTENTLPLLLIDKQVKPGNSLNPQEVSSIKIMNSASSLSSGRLVGKVESGQLLMYFPENVLVKIDLNHVLSNWYNTLQVILGRSKIQSNMPKVIDLRFTNPLVTY